MADLLFVYGTLRPASRHPMAAFLAQHGVHLGLARAPGRLYDLGRYPGMLEPRTDDDLVHGDLYQLPNDNGKTLAELDAYENGESPSPAYFERRLAPVFLLAGDRQEAWVYWFRGNVNEDQRIRDGDWLGREE